MKNEETNPLLEHEEKKDDDDDDGDTTNPFQPQEEHQHQGPQEKELQ